MTIDDSWYTRPAGVPEHAAAGGVVARVDAAGRVLIALAREQGHDTPVLPKGHLRAGEAAETRARREIAEETGLGNLLLLAEMGVRERLNFQRTEWKTTHYYLYGTQHEAAAPTDPKHPAPSGCSWRRCPSCSGPSRTSWWLSGGRESGPWC